MKRYCDGYDSPIFRIHYASGVQSIEMSFGYKALIEYEEDVTTLDVFTDGSKEDITHFYNYEWKLSWVDEIDLTERKKLQQVQDARRANIPVELVPHKDYPWRAFYILIKAEKREFGLDEYFEGSDDTTNNGYEMTFINQKPITEISKADPNIIPVDCWMFGDEMFI